MRLQKSKKARKHKKEAIFAKLSINTNHPTHKKIQRNLVEKIKKQTQEKGGGEN